MVVVGVQQQTVVGHVIVDTLSLEVAVYRIAHDEVEVEVQVDEQHVFQHERK